MKTKMQLILKKIRFDLLWPYLIIIGIALVYALPQLHIRGIYVGADTAFHFNRAFEAMERLKNLNFHNSQISLYGFNKSGRIINALYGPGLGYFFGIILLITKSWLKFQLITNFILTIGSIGLNYWLFNKYSKQKFLSLVFAILLSLTSYWALGYWYQSSGGMPWGMMFIPLVLDAGVQMYSNSEKPVRVIRLSVIMSLILESHMLSFVLSVGILSVFFVAGMVVNHNRILLLKKSVVAAIISVGLTFNYWLDYVNIIRTQSILNPFVNLNPSGLSSNIFQGVSFWLIILSIVLVIAFSGKLLAWQWLLFILGIGFLIVSSGPKFILDHWNNIGFLRTVQFPMRFTLLGQHLLCFFSVVMLSRLSDTFLFSKSVIIAIGVGALLVAGLTISNSFSSYYTSNKKFWEDNDYVASKLSEYSANKKSIIQQIVGSRNIEFQKSIDVVNFAAPDYLPGRGQVFYGDKNYSVVQKEVIDPKVNVDKYVNKKGNLMVTWHQTKSHEVNLPVIVYQQSLIVLNGNKIIPQESNDGVLHVRGRAGVNTIELSVKVPRIVQMGKLTPVLVTLIIVGSLIHSRRKR
ncbi:cytochrome B [Leuconostoc pseudomesenteroides]|uniref:cytochrome B n=1 Tax=Leuconostoc pseudomesenteroides TaxID=33968 RepID=UPI00301BA337